MHTSEGSACGKSSGAEQARAHLEKGYTGVFVTDHFFNGNTAVPRELPWKDRIELFCKGYEHAKEEGDKIGLDVFFGFEYGVDAADFLVYNLDKQWLLEHEDIDREHPRKAFEIMRQDGGFVIHAHPFRERDYIDHIKLFPRSVDGVEIINGAHHGDIQNDRAQMYAKMYELPVTAGSDTHFTGSLFGSGIEAPDRIKVATDYLQMIKDRSLILLDHFDPVLRADQF